MKNKIAHGFTLLPSKRLGVYAPLVLFFFSQTLLASCVGDLGLPSQINLSGSPGLHLPLGYVFSASGTNNGFVDGFLNPDVIADNIQSDGVVIRNYQYSNIELEGGAVVNGDPLTASPAPVQTYIIIYPIIEYQLPTPLENLPPEWVMPEIEFKGPSFEAMLGSLMGIKFRHLQGYILIDGINNYNNDPFYPPGKIDLLADDLILLDGKDVVQENFSSGFLSQEIEDPYTEPIYGASSPPFSLAPLFKEKTNSAPMEITLDYIKPSSQTISIKMLLVLPLTFFIEPEKDPEGRPVYIPVKNENYVKMEIKQLDDLRFDLTAFGNTIKNAYFSVEDVKNDVFSGVVLAFAKGTGADGFYIWNEEVVSLDAGAENPPVSITGITEIPKMAMLTKAVYDYDGDGVLGGSLSIPPQRKVNGAIANEFDFKITLDASTDFFQTIPLK
ncbi:MAG: hypothetical protein LBC53_00730 [Spirochaetaceae bacterium]|jgi:hypothetical protein|nr:hypothetical protein [Spirochaetaceae bacterium]